MRIDLGGTPAKLLALLLVVEIFALLYAPYFLGSRGTLAGLVALLAVPLLRGFRKTSLYQVLMAYSVSVCASIIASFTFPSLCAEYLKSLLGMAIGLFCGFVGMHVARIPRRELWAKTFCWLSLGLVTLGAMEVFIPAARMVSIHVHDVIYGESDAVQLATERDKILTGGLVRPLVGMQEPSYFAIALAVLITLWNLTRESGGRSKIAIAVVVIVGLFLSRSPSFLGLFVVANMPRIRRRRLRAADVIAIVMLTIVALYLIGPRFTTILKGDDKSFNERIGAPFQYMLISLRETSGLGLGCTGMAVEPGNRALDVLFPYVVEAANRAGSMDRLRVVLDNDLPYSMGHFPLLTHFFYHGIPFGILSLYCWANFARCEASRSGAGWQLLFGWVGLSLVGWSYESAQLWALSMILFGFSARHPHGYSDCNTHLRPLRNGE